MICKDKYDIYVCVLSTKHSICFKRTAHKID